MKALLLHLLLCTSYYYAHTNLTPLRFVEQFAPTLAHVYGLGTLYVVHARAAQGDGTFCVRCNKGPVKYEASWRVSGDCRVPLLLHPVKT